MKRILLLPLAIGLGATLGASESRIIDIAPTVLQYLGLPIPEDIDGTPLFY